MNNINEKEECIEKYKKAMEDSPEIPITCTIYVSKDSEYMSFGNMKRAEILYAIEHLMGVYNILELKEQQEKMLERRIN